MTDAQEFNRDIKIPFRQSEKANLLTKNPVVAANFYICLQRVLIEQCFGMPFERFKGESKKTLPRKSEDIEVSNFFKQHYKRIFPKHASSKTPPMGQGLAYVSATEEQARGKEHDHLIVWTKNRPELLQMASRFTFLEKALSKVVDIFTCTEIHPIVQLKHTITKEALRLPQLRYARDAPNYASMLEVKRQANLIAATVNNHAHSFTCKKNKSENCRLGFAAPIAKETGFIQLIRDAEHKVVAIAPTPRDPLSLNKNRRREDQSGLTIRDARTIMVPTKRREINICADDVSSHDDNEDDGETIALDLNENLIDVNLDLWKEHVINLLKSGHPAAFEKKISDSDVAAIMSEKCDAKMCKLVCLRMKSKNLYVSPYNIFATVALRCNTADVRVTSSSVCRGMEMYLVKYMTKGGNEKDTSLSTITKAFDHVEKYKPESRPDDPDEDKREMKKFLMRILNCTDGGFIEMFMTTMALYNQGGRPFQCSHEFTYVFAHDSLRGAKRHFENIDHFDGEDAGSSHGGCTVYKDNDGQSIPISQHDLYLHRIHPGYLTRALALKEKAYREYQERVALVDDDDSALCGEEKKLLETRLARAEHQVDDNVKSFNLREFSSTTHLKPFENKDSHDALVKAMNEYDVNETKSKQVGRKVIF